MRPQKQKPIFIGTPKGQGERAGEDKIGLHLNRKEKEITARANEQEPTKVEYACTSSEWRVMTQIKKQTMVYRYKMTNAIYMVEKSKMQNTMWILFNNQSAL